MEKTPEEIQQWFAKGESLEPLKKIRSKEEIDLFKTIVISSGSVIRYCRDKDLAEVYFETILIEAATRWYEADYNTTVQNAFECESLPAYYKLAATFVNDFSAHIVSTQLAVERTKAATDDMDIPTFEIDPSGAVIMKNFKGNETCE